jgi:hypothetical protein
VSTLTALSAAHLRCWREEGFVILHGFFTAGVLEVADEAEELLERHDALIDVHNLRCRFQPDTRTGACTFECFDPIIDLSPACRNLALDGRLLAAVGDLYGEPACLFKDKLIFKPAGVKGYGLHQDWIAWPGFPRSFLTVLVPLDPATRDNGCTIVYRGYHLGGPLSPQDGQYHELPADLVDEAHAIPLELEPGDVAIFGGFTPHRSDPNRSSGPRRQLYLSYNALSDGGAQREKHYAEFHAWLRKRYAEHGKQDVYFE